METLGTIADVTLRGYSLVVVTILSPPPHTYTYKYTHLIVLNEIVKRSVVGKTKTSLYDHSDRRSPCPFLRPRPRFYNSV